MSNITGFDNPPDETGRVGDFLRSLVDRIRGTDVAALDERLTALEEEVERLTRPSFE